VVTFGAAWHPLNNKRCKKPTMGSIEQALLSSAWVYSGHWPRSQRRKPSKWLRKALSREQWMPPRASQDAAAIWAQLLAGEVARREAVSLWRSTGGGRLSRENRALAGAVYNAVGAVQQ